MSKSRTENTVRNISAGLFNRMITIILPFINRTAILWILGTEFTGLASLFSSILNVLNLAELGFNTAIVHSLYKPMANKDEKKICETVSLFKKIYNIIGTIVLIVGLLLVPFLPYLIKGEYPNSINLYTIYILYLVNSAISYYLFAYKECLLIADQRDDIAKNIRTFVNIIKYICQFIVLLVTKDFYLYLIVSIFGTILTNICIQFATVKMYPFYRKIKGKQKIGNDLKKQVQGLMINKICDTFRNSFDSLIISSFIGLTATAIYGNYYYIYSAIYGIMLVICNAMSASVGNSIVKKDENENYKDLLILSQLFSWILGVATVCLLCLYQPFMKIWAGSDLLLPTFDMILFCIYFYIINMNNIRNQYVSGTGIWWKLKISYVIEAISNLLLNFILGKLFGITGVILATIITIFLFNYLQRNKVLFNNYFKNNSILVFYKEQFYYLFITIIASTISYLACLLIRDNSILHIIIKGIIAFSVSNIVIALSYMYTKRFKDTKVMINRIINTLLHKKKAIK